MQPIRESLLAGVFDLLGAGIALSVAPAPLEVPERQFMLAPCVRQNGIWRWLSLE